MIQLQSVNVKKNATVHVVMGQKYTCPTVMSKLRDEGWTKGSSSLSHGGLYRWRENSL